MGARGVRFRDSTLLVVILTLIINAGPATAKKNEFVDQCAGSSKELKDAEGSVTRLFVGRSLLGAALGLTVGLIASGGKKDDAARGALVGAAAGAASAYLETKKRANSDRAALAGSVYEDAARSNVEAARALRAFSQIRTCRIAEAGRIKAAAQRGEMTREAATEQLAEHRRRFEKEIKLAEKFAKNYGEALANFRSAAGYLAEGRPEDVAYLEQMGPKPAPAAPPPPLYVATAAAVVRAEASPKGATLSKLARGESVELLANPSPAWRQIRRSDGTRGFVAARYLVESAPAGPPRVNLARVSPEVRTLAQPMFEGMEKRGAFEAELQVANRAAADATFSL